MANLGICIFLKDGKFIYLSLPCIKSKTEEKADHGKVENICIPNEKLPWQKIVSDTYA